MGGLSLHEGLTTTRTDLFPVAYTIGTTFKPADRSASESLVHWNRFGA